MQRKRDPQRIEPGPGQESVWDYPRPPRVEPTDKRIRVIFNGETVAETTRALRVPRKPVRPRRSTSRVRMSAPNSSQPHRAKRSASGKDWPTTGPSASGIVNRTTPRGATRSHCPNTPTSAIMSRFTRSASMPPIWMTKKSSPCRATSTAAGSRQMSSAPSKASRAHPTGRCNCVGDGLVPSRLPIYLTPACRGRPMWRPA